MIIVIIYINLALSCQSPSLIKYQYIFVIVESVIDSDSSWFVNFYSPMCSHCHHLAPTWKEVAKLLSGVVKIAVVNCKDNRKLCYQVGINAYPTLLHFKKVSRQNLSVNL